jgi:hypothetical protein
MRPEAMVEPTFLFVLTKPAIIFWPDGIILLMKWHFECQYRLHTGRIRLLKLNVGKCITGEVHTKGMTLIWGWLFMLEFVWEWL